MRGRGRFYCWITASILAGFKMMKAAARLYFFPQWLKSQAEGLQILEKIHSYTHICIIFFILSFLALLKPELFFMALGKGKGIHYKHFYKYYLQFNTESNIHPFS